MEQEGIINELEGAIQSKDYPRAAQIIRFVREEGFAHWLWLRLSCFVVRRDSSIVQHIAAKDLFSFLLNEDDPEVSSEIYELLNCLLDTADFPSIHSTFGVLSSDLLV